MIDKMTKLVAVKVPKCSPNFNTEFKQQNGKLLCGEILSTCRYVSRTHRQPETESVVM